MPTCPLRPTPAAASPTARSFRPVEQLESRAYFAAAPAVSSLTLIDAATDHPVGLFASGATLAVGGGQAYSVEAGVAGGAQSVRFEVDGKLLRTENYAPLAIAGDDGRGDYAAWSPPAGTHALRVTPFAGRDGTGLAGPSVTVTFTAVVPAAEVFMVSDASVAGGPTVAASPAIAAAAAAVHPLGGNLNSQSDRVQDLAFVDLVKTTRGFYNVAGRKASNGFAAFAYADANGWPTEDFTFAAVDNSEWKVPVDAGTYHLSFRGPAAAAVTGSAASR